MQNSGWLVDFSCSDKKKVFPKFKGQDANENQLLNMDVQLHICGKHQESE